MCRPSRLRGSQIGAQRAGGGAGPGPPFPGDSLGCLSGLDPIPSFWLSSSAQVDSGWPGLPSRGQVYCPCLWCLRPQTSLGPCPLCPPTQRGVRPCHSLHGWAILSLLDSWHYSWFSPHTSLSQKDVTRMTAPQGHFLSLPPCWKKASHGGSVR